MGLGLAGAISGIGNALNQGLQTLNSGIVQMGVNQSLAKNDRDFQLEKLQVQLTHAERLQKEKLTADKENNLAVIDAQNKNTLALQELRGAQQEKLQGMQDTAAGQRLDKQLGAQQTNELMRLGVTKEIHDKDRASLEARYEKQFGLEAKKINLEKNKMQLVATDDGKMVLFSPDGKSHGYLTDGSGNVIKGGKDLPESAKMELTSVLEEMKGLERDRTRNGSMWSDEQKDAFEKEMTRYREQYNEILKRHGIKTAEKPAPPVIKIPDKYLNMTPNTTPGVGTGPTSQAPISTPPGLTKSSGLTGAIKGVVPGLGMIENYLKK